MNRLLDLFKGLGAGKTAVVLGLLAMAVAGLVVYYIWNTGPDFQVLYSNLSPEDAGAVIDSLNESKVPYKVNGNMISVPVDKVYETRMKLAGDGLPQGGGVGFEIFDKTGFGVTAFVQKVNYKRALQGELARTIAQIKEVDSARVHLALPDKGVFLDDQKRARASIIVKLKPGGKLSPARVNAIVHLVSNSFENLKPEDVAVVDTSGRMWTREDEGDDVAAITASQLELRRSLETEMEKRVRTMLEKTVGVGKVVARVSMDIDTKRIERTEESYDPDSQVVRSEQRNKDSSTGSAVAVGVPGTASNMPDSAAMGNVGAATPPSSLHEDEVINYEISKVVSRVVEPIGAVRRLSVSVLVDGNYEVSEGKDGEQVRKYIQRSDAELAGFASMVKAAIGFDEKRGDIVSVVSTPFEAGMAGIPGSTGKKPLVPYYLIPSIIKYASTVIVAFFAIFFILRPIVRRLVEEKKALDMIQKGLPGLQAGKGELALGAGAEEAEEEGAKIKRAESEERLVTLKKFVRENPQQVAMMLRGWIKENG